MKDPPGELWALLTRSCFLMGEPLCLPSFSSLKPAFMAVKSTFLVHAPTLIFSLSLQGAALVHLDSLPPNNLVTWTDGSVHFPFDKGSSGMLINCLLCGTELTLFFSTGPVCSGFSTKACIILQALHWSREPSAISLLRILPWFKWL